MRLHDDKNIKNCPFGTAPKQRHLHVSTRKRNEVRIQNPKTHTKYTNSYTINGRKRNVLSSSNLTTYCIYVWTVQMKIIVFPQFMRSPDTVYAYVM